MAPSSSQKCSLRGAKHVHIWRWTQNSRVVLDLAGLVLVYLNVLLLPCPRVGVRAPDLLSGQGGHCWMEGGGTALSWAQEGFKGRAGAARGPGAWARLPPPLPRPMLPQANIPQLILLPVADVEKWRHRESQAVLGNGGVSHKCLTGFLGCNLHFPLQPRKQRLTLCLALGEGPAEDGGLENHCFVVPRVSLQGSVCFPSWFSVL